MRLPPVTSAAAVSSQLVSIPRTMGSSLMLGHLAQVSGRDCALIGFRAVDAFGRTRPALAREWIAGLDGDGRARPAALFSSRHARRLRPERTISRYSAIYRLI